MGTLVRISADSGTVAQLRREVIKLCETMADTMAMLDNRMDCLEAFMRSAAPCPSCQAIVALDASGKRALNVTGVEHEC